MNSKITLPELIDMLAENSGLSKKSCESFLKDFFSVLEESLLNGESVKIKGFGTFKSADVEARKSVDVNTGEEIEIPGYKKVILTVDKAVASAVNAPFNSFETVELPDEITEEALDIAVSQTPPPIPGDSLYEDDDDSVTEADSDTESEVAHNTSNSTVIATPPELPVSLDETEQSEGIIDTQNSEIQTPSESIDTTEATGTTEVTDIADSQEEATPQPVSTFIPPVYTNPELNNSNEDNDDDKNDDNDHKSAFRRGLAWGAILGVIIAAVIVLIGYIYIDYRFSQIEGYDESDTDTEIISEPDTIATDNSIEATPIAATTEQAETTAPQPQEKLKTDTVRRNRFLTTMAREYYGDYHFWVYIYEENATILGDPNRLDEGTVVNIPPAAKYGIDKNNPASLAAAEAKADEISARFRK